MGKGKKILLLGTIMALMGMCRLFREEQTMAKHRCKQAMGWAVFGFGIAYMCISGWALCRKRWQDIACEVK
ncbi:hypothetical protein SAMN05444487_105165 [Marininema mesophilum]|uniref:Uncharacterized protein n=1 Tax=Marininema mesophilum TaxID=1048340 RepID=A0A1H2VP23_9BACL|nr:hypothetical protein [Marininema mesophilum]SDW70053.1 hypothetical protein SAMN05444487_105165 [Marininema mesophilum]